jgi:hypothetical protein
VKFAEVLIRALVSEDLTTLDAFRCSAGEPWEASVEQQVRGPLPRRYLGSPPRFDGRMLLGTGPGGDLLVIGAHHIEPALEPDVGYTEAVAVSLAARGNLVELPGGREISLAELMFLAIFRQMISLGRHRRTFARVDRRNRRSLALCHRVGLVDGYPDPTSEWLVQCWGELPQDI